MGIIVKVSDHVGVFIFHQLTDENGQFRLVLCEDTGEADIGQEIVIDIGVGIVGGDVIVFGMQRSVTWHILMQVIATLTDDTDGRWRNVPIGVNVSEPLF